MALFVRHNHSRDKRMFASLPFILILIFQGFARQDCAEFLCGNQDLASTPSHSRNLKALEGLLIHFSTVTSDQKNIGDKNPESGSDNKKEIARFSVEGSRILESGFLEIQRSRDGPVG